MNRFKKWAIHWATCWVHLASELAEVLTLGLIDVYWAYDFDVWRAKLDH